MGLPLQEWTHGSVNFYQDPSGWHLVPVVVAVLGIAWLGLLILGLAGRLPRRRCWGAAGVVALIGWLALDALWQLQLGRQAAATYRSFAGQPVAARLLAAEGELYRMIQDFRQDIEPSAHVFVSSQADYGGMRAAFHLYPLNVYWRRFDQVPPARSPALRAGDYLVIVAPSSAKFHQREGFLQFGEDVRIDVSPISFGALGGLFRVR